MAAPTLTSAERLNVYRLMFLLNRSFHCIVQRLDELAETGICDLREMRGLTQEVQLEINTEVLSSLDSIENNDFAQFGKVRNALEKRLRGGK